MEPIDESNAGIEQHSFVTPIAEPAAPKPAMIAPVWHTVVLILAIVSISFIGVYRHPGGPGAAELNRMHTYGVTAVLEVVLMGWVALGLRLRGLPLRSLFGNLSTSFRSIALDAGIAILFWMGSLMVLATVAVMWIGIEAAVTHKPLPIQTRHDGKPITSDPSQEKAARAVVQLAPTNGKEVAC